jgi:hypothetical protein
VTHYGPALTELEVRKLLKKGGRLEIRSLQDSYNEAGTIKGEWTIDFIDNEEQRFAIRLTQRSEVKIYKTPASIFNLCAVLGLVSANIPLKANTSVTLEVKVSN